MQVGLHNAPSPGPPVWTHSVTERDQGSTADALVRELLERDDRPAALAAVVAAYGAELFGLLLGVLDNSLVADEVYADVLARAAVELEHFDGRHPLRIWLYAVARGALRDRRQRQHRRGDDATVDDVVSDALLPVVAAVRRGLSEEERELLILRIDRALDWDQLALVELGGDAPTAQVRSEAQRVSARFEKLLERVRALAELELKQR